VKQIDKYIGQTVFSGIAIVLLILIGLFTFFAFIDEVDDVGKQRYGIWQAIQYVILGIPRHIYDIFPNAALLGSLLGLGMLANQGELTVMRAAGISVLRIVGSVLKMGLLLTFTAMLIGEIVAPRSEQYALEMRATAQSEHEHQQMAFSTRYGFWARDGHDFINIRTIFPDGGFGGIALYEFDTQSHLQTLTYARVAYYENGHWLLKDVEKNFFQPTQVSREYLPTLTWDALLKPELIKIVVIRPNKLSSIGLYKYINYLKQNGQRTAPYELAFWSRLSYPLISATMIVLAIPFVFGSLRSVSVGQRVLVGALLGVGFYMFNQTSGDIGLVYGISPLISAFLPPTLFLVLALILIRRQVV
jgi:lipopolysaccharide export system permease protein